MEVNRRTVTVWSAIMAGVVLMGGLMQMGINPYRAWMWHVEIEEQVELGVVEIAAIAEWQKVENADRIRSRYNKLLKSCLDEGVSYERCTERIRARELEERRRAKERPSADD